MVSKYTSPETSFVKQYSFELRYDTNVTPGVYANKNNSFVYNHNTKVPYSLYFIKNPDEYKNVRIEKIKEQKN